MLDSCTASSNTRCIQCTQGSYSSGEVCEPWSPPCADGKFEMIAPLATTNRVCLPCVEGTWRRIGYNMTTCERWTVCGKGETGSGGTSNTMWRKLFHSGFETCFGPSTQGAGIRYQNTSQIQIFRHFEKKGRDVNMWD